MYNAIIAKIHVRPHPNADKIQLGTICGEQVIVGLETNDGDLMIYFPCDGQLSEEFAAANNLVGYTDAEGVKRGGFFSKNRRVRAQKFRGEKSEGFACPLDYVQKLFQKELNLKLGDEFSEVNEIPICQKYVTPATMRGLANKQQKAKKKNLRFPQHFDTKQFRREGKNIPENAIIYLTEKCHGTSARYSYVQEEVQHKASWYKRIFGAKPTTTLEYNRQAGSRRVIMTGPDQRVYHGKADFRYDVIKNLCLRKGEIVYGEIVGYCGPQTTIMPSVSTSGLNDKAFKKRYGKVMTYKYGCPEGTCKLYVYRVAMVNEDGRLVDLSWPQVKARCDELGLMHVPDLYPEPIVMKDLDGLTETIKELLDGPSMLDESHIREGVAIRIETARGIYVLKEKSFPFKVLEGIAKDDSEYVDMEEEQGESDE